MRMTGYTTSTCKVSKKKVTRKKRITKYCLMAEPDLTCRIDMTRDQR